jgi:predicted acylesterase/phospholipase RssA
VTVYEAARATTSAPTFYSPAVVGGQRLVDGAIIANNPSVVALAEAATLWPGANVEVFVACGTGTVSLRPMNTASLVSWAKTALECSISADIPHRAAGTLLGPSRYYRFDPESLGDIELSEMRLGVLGQMLEEGRRYIHRHEPRFRQLAHALGCGPRARAARKRRRATQAAAAEAAAGPRGGVEEGRE